MDENKISRVRKEIKQILDPEYRAHREFVRTHQSLVNGPMGERIEILFEKIPSLLSYHLDNFPESPLVLMTCGYEEACKAATYLYYLCVAAGIQVHFGFDTEMNVHCVRYWPPTLRWCEIQTWKPRDWVK